MRRGASQASVAASFDLPRSHTAHALLAEQGIADEDVLTVRRTVGADGRGSAFVNDQPASVTLLRRLGDTLVEIQGQMEQHGLLDLATHRASLDAFAGSPPKPKGEVTPLVLALGGEQAVMFAAQGVLSGFQDVVVAGGVESMSRPSPMHVDGFTANNDHLFEQYPMVAQGISADLIASVEGFWPFCASFVLMRL